jgi:uncharacterized protein YciI
MTEGEAALMQEHGEYWIDLVAKGSVIVFGPVADPRGMWGLAVIEADDESQVRAYGANDPAIKAGIGFLFEIYPMPRAAVRKPV